MNEHSGMHVDALLHLVSEGKAHYGIDEVPLETFLGRASLGIKKGERTS